MTLSDIEDIGGWMESLRKRHGELLDLATPNQLLLEVLDRLERIEVMLGERHDRT